MKATKRLVIGTAFMLLMLVGCSVFKQQAVDPNSSLSNIVDAIDASAEAVKRSAPFAGPYGWIAGAIATLVTAGTGAYKVRQKNRTIRTDEEVITAQQREYQAIRTTTKAVVDAIEDIGQIQLGEVNSLSSKDGSLGGAIKEKVAAQLKAIEETGGLGSNQASFIGKQIINSIKRPHNR